MPVLTDIINLSLTTGVFLLSLKHTLVTPLLKKASLDPENPNNYHLVPNLSFVSKILFLLFSVRCVQWLKLKTGTKVFDKGYWL
jgi:hypothetical protein